MAVALALGCTPVEPSVVVTLRSDWEPGLEVDEVRTAIVARRTHLAVRALARGDDLVLGLVVAELDGVPVGTHRLDVALYRAGVFVAGRSAVVPVESTTSVSIAITRNCEGVVCPAPGDPAGSTECEDGRCVSPECLIDCGDGCTADSDCPSESECARGRCMEGLCLSVPDEGVCEAGERCEVGRGCVADQVGCDPMACPAATGCCEGFDHCVSLRSEQRCGACHSSCASGELCSEDGECVSVSVSCDPSSCGPTEGCCTGGSDCVDLRTTANCGRCGNACPVGARCHHDAGTDQTFCTTCSSEDCAGFGVICCPHNSLGNCTNLWSDPNHCGGCDRRCPSGQNCVSHFEPELVAPFCTSCVPSDCAAFGVICCPHNTAGNCTNVWSDRNHCGGCDRRCPSGQNCVSHFEPELVAPFCTSCVPDDCAAFGVICCPHNTAGNCTNVWSDRNHCGGCDRRCAAGQSCSDGVCR